MSLDVTLSVETPIEKSSSGIFVRKNGQTVEVSAEEWESMNPGTLPVTFKDDKFFTNEVFDYNITHNLAEMAEEAGLYEVLWRPEEHGIETASQLIEPLREGLHRLKSDPEKYKAFDPKNGWGDYDGLVRFVEKYLDACYKYKDAKVEASR